jgi:2-polyprenyl-3-methyl-5-hydroxy-6-metoxy-1,4-benzoquinol methylase
LDFGSGEGYFLKMLAQEKPAAKLYGYDPYKDRSCSDFTQVNHLKYLESSSLDVVTVFEVCEHLYETEIHEFLKQAIRLPF